MLSFLGSSEKKKNKICLICHGKLIDIASSPDICKHLFHYKCLRNYVDNRLEKKESIICPEKDCKKFFGRIANKYNLSQELIYQNVILSNDENQCCICFLRYTTPVASSDSCSHSFCCECLKKWCTFKHECPMDRVPIKMLLISDFPGGHITNKIEPPPIEQDLNGDGDNDELINTTCEICNSGQDEHQLLLCDNCNRGYHIYCLPVPLSSIPEGDWFCEQCEPNIPDQPEEVPSTDGQLLRGLGRIVENIQNRQNDNPTANNTQRGRNFTINRRTRTTTRIVRNIRRDDFIVESDEEWSSGEEILHTLRTRNGIDRSRNVGVRTRNGGRRHVAVTDEVEDDEVVLGPRLRRHTHISDSDDASDSTPISTTRSVPRIMESPVPNSLETCIEEPDTSVNEPDTSVVIETRARAAHGSNLRNALRRRRQGSLSSDIESEAEPVRKKRRVKSGSSSSDDSRSSIEDIDFRNTRNMRLPSPITTRLRARESQVAAVQARADSPLPRPTRMTRMICEDSEEEQVTDEQQIPEEHNIVETSTNKNKRLIIDSDSNDEEIIEEDRSRHVSTSSSLSTIPCRVIEMDQMAAELRVEPPKLSHITPQDVFSNSSSCESTSSEYNPALEESGTWDPITSTRRNPTSKRKSSRRKPGKSKRSHREPTSSTDSNKPGRGISRENHHGTDLANCVARDRSFNSSNSILSEINDSQSNLRHEPCSSSLHKKEKIVLTIKNLHMANTNNNAVPHSLPSSTNPVSVTSHLSIADHNTVLCPSSKNIPKPKAINYHTDLLDHTDTGPSTSSSRHSSLTPMPDPNTPESVIVQHVTSALNKYYSKTLIDHNEFKSLNDRIVEKVVKKKGSRVAKAKIVDFVGKYMAFYLDRRSSGDGGSGAAVH